MIKNMNFIITNLIFYLLLVSSIYSQHNNCIGNCCDKNINCGFWAKRNECKKTPSYMLMNCPKSCQTCKGQDPTKQEVDKLNFSGCKFVQTRETTRRVAMNARIFSETVVSRDCGPENVPNNCSQSICFHKQFRSMDGSCNNLKRPLFGAAFTSYIRLQQPLYEDNFNKPVGKIIYRPDARDVTRFLLIHDKNIISKYNQLAMQFGQFLAHDILANGRHESCRCDMVNAPHCQNIYFKRGDPKFGKIPCIRLARTVNKCGTGIFGVPREQMNQATAYIDGSQIYGNNNGNMEALRSRQFLRTTIRNGKEFPPMGITEVGGHALITGDNRADIFSGLSALHTIFVRYHNIIARKFMKVNPSWSTDRIFQETRKIVGSILQVITFEEFLPAILGPDNYKTLIPTYSGYKEDVDATISNEFAAAGFRLHGTIVQHYPLIDERYRTLANNDFIQNVETFIREYSTKISLLVRGMIASPLKKAQRINPQITEKFFGGTVDLSSMNLQRGRDHGLRTYNDYRKLCQLPIIESFEEWDDVSDNSVKKKAKELYRNINNIDLFTGAMLEEPLEGSVVGPTFACIISEQFLRLRDGDRFWYENNQLFTPQQINNLKKMSIASVICATEPGIKKIPRYAFEADKGDKARRCEEIPQIDITLWKSF
ncbi:Peroxidasin-like protein [Strongyloides ratti]|uniref:peroxidase n=1 Tax=Strongyloides ratti TaxID=34506 RepID=A0A090KRN5_STRRB|nr:Peroxidasin-like protein [Strongyloides ratti]CEF60050.1 Peroxidasin-like protein [Strongyloides ratti]